MKAAVIAGAVGVFASLVLFYTPPSHAQMMGWSMCREGYVYEPSRNVCVHSKKAKRPAVKKKITPQM